MNLIAILACFSFSAVVVMQWRLGMALLLLSMPFIGGLSLLVASPYVLIGRDILFVLPMYVGCLLTLKKVRGTYIPRPFLIALAALFLVVLIQSLNPEIYSYLVAAIGTKIWLFYIPLVLMTIAYLRNERDLVRLLRLMLALTIVPCAVAWLQWIGSNTLGYVETMTFFYGDAAAGATQNFALFEFGNAVQVFRIPSTFSYPTQMFGYLFSMIVVAFSLSAIDSSSRWRTYARLMLWTLVATSLIIGIRSAWVFVPMLVIVCLWLQGKVSKFVGIGAAFGLLVISIFGIVGIPVLEIFGTSIRLIDHYSETLIFSSVQDAVINHPFGIGTGMNTGASRYAFSLNADAKLLLSGVESYYAKSIIELGVFGFLVVVSIFGLLIRWSWKVNVVVATPYRVMSAALCAFFICLALNSLKGWQIDLDPINYLFWIFVGILARLPALSQAHRLQVAPSPREPVQTAGLVSARHGGLAR